MRKFERCRRERVAKIMLAEIKERNKAGDIGSEWEEERRAFFEERGLRRDKRGKGREE